MKFQTIRTEDVFAPGRLFGLLEEIREGKPANSCKRLTVDELATIPSIYATLPTDVYIPEIPDEEKIKTGNDKVILGKDLKAITMLMYLKPRSAYCNFGKEKQMRSTASGAIPLGLLGFKRYKDIPYEKWRLATSHYVTSKIVKSDDKENLLVNIVEIEKIFKIDLLLGKTLASTYYDEVDETIKLNEEKNWGLILASAFQDINIDPATLRYLREKGMGNYRGHFASVYGTSSVPVDKAGINKRAILLYNKCSTPMRLLLAQRWAWYGMHRSSDAINDFQDWDNMPKNLDNMSAGFVGIAPLAAEGGGSGKSVFGV